MLIRWMAVRRAWAHPKNRNCSMYWMAMYSGAADFHLKAANWRAACSDAAHFLRKAAGWMDAARSSCCPVNRPDQGDYRRCWMNQWRVSRQLANVDMAGHFRASYHPHPEDAPHWKAAASPVSVSGWEHFLKTNRLAAHPIQLGVPALMEFPPRLHAHPHSLAPMAY
jgi:hypothetical protein